MKRSQFSSAEHGTSAVRTPWLLHRMRGVAAFARRWAHRNDDAAMNTVPSIEDQLRGLRAICSAHWVSTGLMCCAPAVAVAEIHAIDECNHLGLSPDGNLVETLCQACLADVRSAMATYVGERGTRPVCTTCGRPTGSLHSVFAVRPIGPAGLAS